MARPLQRCPMCKETKEVAKSHLLPKSLYLHLQDGKSSPVIVANGVVMPSDRQIAAYLLCDDCEDILNKKGEAWVCPKLGWWDRRFELYDMLEKAGGHIAGDGEGMFYAKNNPQIDVEKIVHFATGIFWRAAVHSWKGGVTEPMIDLGWDVDEIRRYLRGEASFPKQALITMVISTPPTMQITMNQPVEIPVKWGWRVWSFHVLGVLFSLNLGWSITAIHKDTCFYRSPANLVLVSQNVARQWEQRQARQFHEARKTQAYRKMEEKRRKG
jgi:hypothetical protein